MKGLAQGLHGKKGPDIFFLFKITKNNNECSLVTRRIKAVGMTLIFRLCSYWKSYRLNINAWVNWVKLTNETNWFLEAKQNAAYKLPKVQIQANDILYENIFWLRASELLNQNVNTWPSYTMSELVLKLGLRKEFIFFFNICV